LVFFFAIFDGHDGPLAAAYCEMNMHHYIDNTEFFDTNSLKKCVLDCDRNWLNNSPPHDGCTATMALVKPKETNSNNSNEKRTEYDVVFINVGDSRCILAKTDKIFVSTLDHKPSDQQEKDRIVRAGGRVSMGRVDGELAVSRAIGDAQFKGNKSLPLESQMVCSLPDITIHSATEGDWILLACDGIFEGLTNEEVVEFINTQLKDTEDPALILSRLLSHALYKSKDNMSAILVLLKTGAQVKSSTDFIPGPYQAEWGSSFLAAYKKDLENHGIPLEKAIELLNSNH